MNYFNNLKIGTRLVLAFSLLVLLIVLVGLQSVIKAKSVQSGLEDITERRMLIVAEANDLRLEVNRQARSIRNIALLATINQREKIKVEEEAVEKSRKHVADILAIMDKQIQAPKGREILAEMLASRTKFADGLNQFIKQIDNGQQQEAVTFLLEGLRPVQLAYLDDINEMVKFQTEGASTASAAAVGDVAALQTTVIAAVLVAALMAIVLGVWIVRSITRPINQAVGVARAVAEGDLTLSIRVNSTDETGQLLQALSDMQAGLVKVVANVRNGSESVSTASAEIAQGNNDLSARTEQQASALEETAASMEELSSTVKQNADSARQANQLAMSASTVAVQGGEVVGQVVETMKGINESSRKISDIISVIDGIAFQTNILALNAAVEAARAGEQGRGFAVVASEVRSLAGRSAEAAKEIKTLIGASVERVEQGTALVDKAGTTMTEVVSSIKRVTDLMGEISAASNEQSAGVSQIGEAVQPVAQVPQQTAALVEEMAAAASSLKSQAGELVQTVAIFKLDSATKTVVRAAPPNLAQS